MILRRWNYLTHQYEPYKVPDDWYVTAYEADMETNVNCACLRKTDNAWRCILFDGNSYSVGLRVRCLRRVLCRGNEAQIGE